MNVAKMIKMTEKQFLMMAERECKKRNLESDTIDFKSMWDSNITYQENKHAFIEYLKQLKGEFEIDQKAIKEQQKDYLEQQEILAYEQLKDKAIDGFYYYLSEYVKLVSKSQQIHSLFLIGKHGIGKTWNTITTLLNLDLKQNEDFYYYAGKITPKALYHILYKNRNKILFFDDTLSIIKDSDCLSILFSALWSPTGTRIIRWNTTRENADLPDEFEFTGKILFSLNEISDSEMLMTLISRCLSYELVFSYNEIVMIMEQIANQKHGKLTTEQRKEVLEFIKENTNESTKDFDLRLQSKAETIYSETENWKVILLPQLQKDKLKSLALLMSEADFISRGYGSRATYYRYKRRD